MDQNLTQLSPHDDEIDLREILKKLIESKKLIISSILIFTILGYVYSLSLEDSFTTSTKIEIGYYDRSDGSQKIIENQNDVISDLKILLLKNTDNQFNQGVSIQSIEDRVIVLKTTSVSVEQNEKILNEIISYTIKRHSKNLDFNTNILIEETINSINLFQDAIAFREKMIQDNPDADLQDQIFMANDLFTLKKELSALKNKLKTAKTQTFKITQTFGGLETITNEPKIEIYIFLGLIFGLITGIVLALIRNFVKSFKESQA